MSGLEQRTKGLSEAPADASAVSAVAARSSNTEDPGAPHLSRSSGWPEIEGDLLDDRRVYVPAFPLEPLPPPWRDWVSDAARSADAPVDYVAQAVLAAVAGVVGSRVVLSIAPGWLEPLLLRLAVVGAASTGKTPALLSVRRLLITLEREPGDGGDEPRRQIVLREARFEQMAATLARNPRGMLLWRDGAAGCLAPLGGGRSLRDLDPYAVSILGSIEPDRLTQDLPRGGDGLAARFLYAWPTPSPFRPLADRKPLRNEAVLTLLRRLLQAIDTSSEPHLMVVERSGAAAFDVFLARLDREIRQAEGLEAAWLGKGRGTVACLAGTLALLRWSAGNSDEPPRRIGLEAMEHAVSLWSDYYRPHARAFLQRALPTDLECRARRVVRWLRADGRAILSREDVRRTALGETVDARESDRVLARLVEGGVLRRLAADPRPQGGRPALRWQVNPLLTAAQS
jgi:Protein of unknown function (DUF3987)